MSQRLVDWSALPTAKMGLDGWKATPKGKTVTAAKTGQGLGFVGRRHINDCGVP